MEPTRRLFVAVRIPLLPQLSRLSEELRELGSPLRVVAPHNWHVTLKFLGNTSVEQEELIVELLTKLAAATPAFGAEVRGTGAFPHARRPTVLWAGLDPPDDLARLATEIANGCEPLGFSRETRPWQAHLTLAYVKRRPPDELHAILQRTATTRFGDIAFRELELIESTLTREGPIYTTVAGMSLQEA